MTIISNVVIPAQAGIQSSWVTRMLDDIKSARIDENWIPAYAGMTDDLYG